MKLMFELNYGENCLDKHFCSNFTRDRAQTRVIGIHNFSFAHLFVLNQIWMILEDSIKITENRVSELNGQNIINDCCFHFSITTNNIKRVVSLKNLIIEIPFMALMVIRQLNTIKYESHPGSVYSSQKRSFYVYQYIFWWQQWWSSCRYVFNAPSIYTKHIKFTVFCLLSSKTIFLNNLFVLLFVVF